VIGIDRGINNVAVTSENTFHSGKQVKRICNRYQQLRSKLQSCGSKSAKRHLRKLSGKENRFKKDCNHKISKQIISLLPEGCTIVLEDLKWITNKNRGKRLNKSIGTWSYFQLEEFLTYKAEEKDITIVKVDPHFTSQKCSHCGHTEKRNRIKGNFKCCECGFSLNADLNAARNIKQKHLDAISDQIGLSVNQPIVSAEHLVLSEASRRL
jgi:IS605 OrfB family transposase